VEKPKKQYTKAEKASWFNGVRYGLNKPRESLLYLQQRSDGKHPVPEGQSSFDADEFYKAALYRTYGEPKPKPRYVRGRARLKGSAHKK